MDFENFLGKMSSQGAANLRLPNSEEIMQRHMVEEAPPAPVQAPRPAPVPAPAPAPRNPDVITEETVERVYEATSAILKTIRQAFPNKAERRMAFESIQNAIAMALNDGNPIARMPVQYQASAPAPRPQNRPPVPQGRPPRGQMVEDGDYIVPRQQMLEEDIPFDNGDNYSRAIDIRPGQGLVGVSDQDLADLKTLAGI